VSDANSHRNGVTGGANFLRAGSGEMRRQLDRFSLNRKLGQLGGEREAALGVLGEKAWDAKIDLTPFAEVRDHLEGVAARSGELAAGAQQLESQKAALERQRRDAVTQGKARREAIEAKKRPIDASLTAARHRHADTERERALSQARLAVIAGELAAAMPSPGGAQPSAENAEQRQTRLLSEQGAVRATLAASEAELPRLAAQINELQAQSARSLQRRSRR
jgi:chromosome segregation ATPase